ncbi:hypothetical protein D3C84_842920 [compost metagenome]
MQPCRGVKQLRSRLIIAIAEQLFRYDTAAGVVPCTINLLSLKINVQGAARFTYIFFAIVAKGIRASVAIHPIVLINHPIIKFIRIK